GAQHRQGFLGARLVALDERADHREAAVAGPVGQRAAQRGSLHLLGRALRIGARHGAVHGAAAGVLRRAQRALPGPPGALLPVRLLAAAAYLTTRLGGVRAPPGRRFLRHHDLVHERDVHLDGEDLTGQLDIRTGLAGRSCNTDRGHLASPPVSCLAALRIRTRPPLGPGTAPLISSSPRSASTACTVSRGTVVLALPIRPAIFMPWNTRPGVAHPPMDPGDRCLRWVPWEAPRPLKPYRFITPAVPLPLLRPVTSTRSPAPNVSAVSSWPSVYWSASSVRSS